MASTPKKDTENTKVFTVDSGTATQDKEMPSVTKLLNRKSLGLAPKKPVTPPPKLNPPLPPQAFPSLTQEEAADHTQEIELKIDLISPPTIEKAKTSELLLTSPSELSIQINSNSNEAVPLQLTNNTLQNETTPPEIKLSAPASSPRIQTTKRKSTEPARALIQWDLATLKSGSDPLGKGIAIIFEKGAKHLLFLSILPPLASSPVPQFISKATVLASSKLPLWTGLKWDPSLVPDVWNQFIKTGRVEFAPPGALTIQTSHRNVIRAAFGIAPSEWLLLLRAGPADQIRGIIAIVSTQTLLTELATALPFILGPAL